MISYVLYQSTGALDKTVDDVWRMVWTQGVAIIVMLTRCYELGRVNIIV